MDSQFVTILDAVTPLSITSSTNATPIEVTKNAHGLVTGDIIVINGHLVNTAANGRWVVTRTGANTFTLDGSVGNGIGANTGTFCIAPKPFCIQGSESCTAAIDTASSANMTVKFVGSIAQMSPDWGEAQSASNQYDFLDTIDLQNGSSIDGDTGFSCAGTDDHRMFEVNVNTSLRWLSVLVTAVSAGTLTVGVRTFSTTNNPS